MAKAVYVEKDFQTGSMKIIEKANEIIGEYFAIGMTLTLRQLYYQFVARGIIPNRQSEYKRIGSVVNDGRMAGLIDWEAIEDRTRNLQRNQHWKNPGEIISAASRSFMLDRWEGQGFRPEVWIEKEALVGVIDEICSRLDVSYFACRGYVSQSEMWVSSQRLSGYWKNGQTPVIIHLGDHDPSGIDMTRDIFDRQKLFMGGLKVERIALNMDQVEQYNPPPNPAKLTDSRCNGYVSMYGGESWELDALEPMVLRNLIEDTVSGYRDQEIYNAVIKKEKEYLKTLKNIEKNWVSL